MLSGVRWRLVMLVLLVALVAGGVFDMPLAFAQEAEGGGEAAAPAKQSTLMWLIHTSGLIGAFLFLISIYFVAKVTQLFMELREQNLAPPEFLAQCDELLAKRDYATLYNTAKAEDSELGQMIASGLGGMSSGLSDAREAVERVGEVITVDLEQKISMLAVIGSLGPMIGLLGTLKGMIASFSVIATSGGQQIKADEVAGGISEALVLTFEGVALSVPAIYFFSLFKNRVSTLTVRAQNLADEFIRRVYASAKGK